MMKISISTFLATLVFVPFLFVGAQTTEQGKLTVTGSSTIAPLMSDIAKVFEQAHPNVRVDVQAGGSSRGIADVRSGIADIGMVSRALTEAEADLNGKVVALDGLTMIIHTDNIVKELSNQQIIAIYLGQTKNWLELGGLDEPIVVVHKAEGRSTLEVFLEYFNIDNQDVRPDIIVGDNQQGIKFVAGNPLAIGYVSVGTAAFEAEQGTSIKLLPINGVPATTENVSNGTFELSRVLTVVTQPEPTDLVKTFIDFALSPDVVPLVENHFFVPVK